MAALLGATLFTPLRLASQTRVGRLRGVVSDTAGTRIQGAEMAIPGTERRTHSNASGSYVLDSVAPGEATVVARHVGYVPGSVPVRISEGGDARVDFQLVPLVPTLGTVTVRTHREPTDARLAGYNERRGSKLGHFITRERLARASSSQLTDLLREIPGVRIGPARGGPMHAIRIRGASCAPLVFIDGFAGSAGEFDLDTMDPGAVEGVEVYSGTATIPAVFVGPRSLDRCGVIAVWSRSARSLASREASGQSDDQASPDSEVPHVDTDVDAPAVLVAGSVTPTYPELCRRHRVGGEVEFEFVVSAAGAIEVSTARLVAGLEVPLIEAVRSALSDARYTPARRGGRTVRQWARLTVAFTPDSAASTK
ncbi:MAG: hypothetical protein NVS9B3_02180 [Gemmatimonadaceae bacterium]